MLQASDEHHDLGGRDRRPLARKRLDHGAVLGEAVEYYYYYYHYYYY